MSPYEELVALARRQALLVADGRWEELVALERDRERVATALPGTPPPEAASALAEADRLVRAATGTASIAVAEARAQLRRLADGRRAVRGYAQLS